MKTRAALFYGPGKPFDVQELELDEPGPGELIVRMTACGICGTDLHLVNGDWDRPVPAVLGHEGAGVVEATGEGVSLQEGDRVVLSWAPGCGECADCRRGRPAACLVLHRAIGEGTHITGKTNMSLGGETVYRGTATGALAERQLVVERAALPLGEGLSLEDAALLGCAALTGVGAVLFAAKVEPGTSVFVIGAGGVGQFCVQGARIAGASEIVVVDPVEGRRDAALGLGATQAFAPEELKEGMRATLPEGADYAFDAVGSPETIALALRWTRPAGHCVMVGIPATGARLDFDPAEFVRREKWLTGTMYGSEDPAVALPILLEHVRSGVLELSSMRGPSFPLEEINEAVEASLGGSAGRVLVTL